MKFQFASDLHLEFPHNKGFLKAMPLIPTAEILILAGDIVPFVTMKEHDDFFDHVAANWEMTYWIPGNHEYYHANAMHRAGSFQEKIRENIILLNNEVTVIEDVNFIFSTMWTNISPLGQVAIQRGMNDFRMIKYHDEIFTPVDANKFHKAALTFIQSALKDHKGSKTVVVTHHVPTFLNYPPLYKGDALNEGFAVELFDFIEQEGPNFWIFGHHHYNAPDFKIGRTSMLSNQLGYVRQNEHLEFKPDRMVSL